MASHYSGDEEEEEKKTDPDAILANSFGNLTAAQRNRSASSPNDQRKMS